MKLKGDEMARLACGVAMLVVTVGLTALSAPPENTGGGTGKPKDTTTPPAAPASQPASAPSPTNFPPVDPKWLDRMNKDDRAAFDSLINQAPPKFADDLIWLGGKAVTWDDLRGRVIVIQTFTTANMAGRKWPERLAASMKDFKAKDVQLIALHTPEEAAGAEEFLSKKAAPADMLVAIDRQGAFCDALNIYKDPANIIVDKHGFLRFAALNPRGVEEAVTALVAEKFEPAKRPAGATSAAASPAKTTNEYPPISGVVMQAKDIRGKQAPALTVGKWITDQPTTDGRVVIVDFWATWCGPCVASIPHMNELAEKFSGQAACIGLSDEKENDFIRGMDKRKLKENTFKYALALDPGAAMKSAIGITAIPHCIVMSKDWVVRWQGHPASLTPEIVQQIIDADGGSASTDPAAPTKGAKRKRWTS